MKSTKAYLAAKRAFLAGKQCAVYPTLKATEIHHIRGRLGPLLNDQRHWLAVSRQGHRWIHLFPDEARFAGWLALPGEWNRTPRTTHRKTLRPTPD